MPAQRHPPARKLTHWRLPPNRPAWSDQDRRPRERKSPTGETAGSDRILGHQHMRQQSRPRKATLNGARWRGASTTRSHFLQANFGRTWRITLKLAGMYSRISATSSPKLRNWPPQSGQQSCPERVRYDFAGKMCGQRLARRAGLEEPAQTLTLVLLSVLQRQPAPSPSLPVATQTAQPG